MPRKFILASAAAVALLASAAPAGAQVVDTRLFYEVPQAEAGSVATDDSGHANNGVLKGGVTRVHGVYRFHALSRDHRYDRIQTPDDASLSPGLSPFTFGVRLKVSPHAEWSHSDMAVIRHGDTDSEAGGNYKMQLSKNRAGVVSAYCVIRDDDGSGVGYIRGRGGLKTVDDGHWHTITCGRVDANTVSLTIDDNVAQRTIRGDLGNVVGSVPLLIGCQLAGQGPTRREQFVGRMDDITISVS